MLLKKGKFIIVIIAIAILILGMALAICGILFGLIKEALTCLLLLDRAGFEREDVKFVIDKVDKYYETRDETDAVEGYAALAISITVVMSDKDGEKLGVAIYEAFRKKATIVDLHLLSKFNVFGNISSLKRIYYNILKAQDMPSWSEQDSIFSIIVKNAEGLSQGQCVFVAENFVNICNYVYMQKEEKLISALDNAELVYKYRKELFDKVSIRQILDVSQYFASAMLNCNNYDEIFTTLYQVSEYKIFDILSKMPTSVRIIFEFVSGLEVVDYADIISYSHDYDICVALLHYIEREKLIESVEIVSCELNKICQELSIDFDFKYLWEYVIAKTPDGEYVCIPSKLDDGQKEVILQSISPLIEFMKMLIQ